jgi:hypothetical protein
MSKQKFDRSQFKATKVDALQEQSKQVDELNGSSGTRAKVLELEKDGSKNRLRIFPKHPGTKSYAYPKTVHFLKIQATDKEGALLTDEQGNPKLKNQPIFNSRVHGGTSKDIIDEYINFVYKLTYDQFQDDDTRKKYLRLIEGWKDGGRWKPGIKSQTRWIVYGDLNGTFGRVELPTTVKDKLNEIAAGQDGEDGVAVVDPFTDIDTGRKVFVEFHKEEKDPKKKYAATIDINKQSPLTDEQFEALLEQKPLEEIYHKVYSRKEFMMSLDGLKRFDEASVAALKEFGFGSGYEVFTHDAFLDIAEEISGYYKDVEESGTEEEDDYSAEEEDEQNDPPFESDKDTSELTLDDMSMSEMKAYAKANSLSIRFLPSYTEDQVRQFIKEEMELIEEERNEAVEERVVDSEEAPKAPRLSRLSNLKDSLKTE